MADKGIIFSAPMVRALLAGRKTQTRRLLKARFGMGEPVNLREHGAGDYSGRDNDPTSWGYPFAEDGSDMSLADWPEVSGYRRGDRLYVREAWRVDACYDDLKPSDLGGEEGVRYEVDGAICSWTFAPRNPGRYRAARFMPRWASRLTLTVTDVRVQRVQDISEADAIAEGIEGFACIGGNAWRDYSGGGGFNVLDSGNPAKRSFASLWNSLHTRPGETWGDNPWICAVSFAVERRNIDG